MRVLGLSCDYHDAAAALVVDGIVVAAAEEERFTRLKHDNSLPAHAANACLAIAGIDADDVDVVVFHEKPLAVLNRVVAARQRRGPRSLGTFAREMPTMISRNLMIGYRSETLLRDLGATKPIPVRYSEHHLSHAAAAFLPSPFDSAAILTVDGIGEWATATIGRGLHGRVDLLEELRYPNSLGLLYSLATRWCGFEPNDGEYKLMGLAPYGSPRFVDQLRDLIELHDDGSFEVDAKRLGWWTRKATDSRSLAAALGGPPLAIGGEVTAREADLARSVQDLTEEILLRMARHAHDLTGSKDLCLAGGVALNCVANGRIEREGPFDRIWIQPAAGDAGSAIGAALWYWNDQPGNERPALDPANPVADGMSGAQLGPSFDTDEVGRWADGLALTYRRVSDVGERCGEAARLMADGKILGWFEGAMEFGPRALGHRSILADPRSPTVQREINMRVKGRESFRPFAPAVLWEHATDWFEIEAPSPYMLKTHQVRADQRIEPGPEPTDMVERVQVPRSTVPACTHIDGSARVQTVHRETNPVFHQLIEAFHQETGCPVLLNTSFNRAGEPVVCTPDDALASARVAGLDVLVVEDLLIQIDGPHVP